MPEWLNYDAIARVFSSARKTSKNTPITDVAIKGPDGETLSNGLPVAVAGSRVEEQKTEADATTGTLTFAENINFIGIYNRDTANDGVFNVNGIGLTVPAGESAEFNVGGTPRATVTVTGSTSYIVTRYV